MLLLQILLLVYLALGCLFWLWRAWGTARMIRTLPVLAEDDSPAPPRWPRVSVIVPARDEADQIASAMASLLAQDYPDLQIILVDDRSRDGTGEVMDRLAESDPRVRVLHLTRLPDGWLGKVHALQRGLDSADGEYVLLTDADVHYRPDTLRRAMRYCLAEKADHVAGLPELYPSGLLLGAMIGAFLPMLNLGVRFWKVNDDDSPAAMGVGAFNLVRREALDGTDGLEWLRMEVADDAGLGLLMKQSGLRSRLVNFRDFLGLHWYRTVGQMMAGVEKSYAPVANCSLGRCVLTAGLFVAVEAAPYVGLAWGLSAWWSEGLAGWRPLAGLVAACVSAVCLAAFAVTTVRAERWAKHSVLPGLLASLGTVLLAAGFLRAGVLGFCRGGVRWRDTFYPNDQLRAGRRVMLFK